MLGRGDLMTAISEGPRLLLLALDALPYSLLDKWCNDGSLPNLRRLRDEGNHGVVTSDADLFPGGVWPTVFTQTDISHHANYHLVQWDPVARRLRPPGPGWCEVTPFWHELGTAGIPSIVLDVPFSDTGRSVPNVVEIIGWGMHEGVWDSSRPARLLNELRRRYGAAEQLREGPGERGEEEIVRELPGLVRDVGRRASIVEDLATRFDWRLLLAVFTESHRAGHWFWEDHGTGEPQGGIKEVVKAFDAVLPRLRRLLKPQDQLVVFSAHGMSAGYDVDRLGEAALLYLNPPNARGLTRKLDPVYLLRRALPLRIVRSIARKLPQPVYNWTYYRLQNNHGDWAGQEWVVHPLDYTVYFHTRPGHTPADAARSAARLDWLESQLRGITTPDGKPVVQAVIRPHERYSGPRLALLPEMLATVERRTLGPELVLADGSRRFAPRHSSRDGEHRPEGFYIRLGPGVQAGEGPAVAGQRLARFFCEPAGLAGTITRA
jgi:predicted AlkP superfamily phosphohydrolase/phosphomutase